MALQNKRPIIAEERRHRVLQLKMAGFSDRQIATQVKVTKTQVQRDWKKRLGELAREDIHAATVIRTLAMLRYEALFLRWWPLAVNPKITPALAQTATEQVLKILKAEREINGLDPEEPIIINVDGRQITINGLSIHDAYAQLQALGAFSANGVHPALVLEAPPKAEEG